MNWKEFLKISLKNNSIRFVIGFYVILVPLLFSSIILKNYLILGFVFITLGIIGWSIFLGGLNFGNWTKEVIKFIENSFGRKVIMLLLGFIFEIIGGFYTGVLLIGLPLGFLGLEIINAVLKGSIKSKIKLIFLSLIIYLIFIFSVLIGALPLIFVG